MNKRIEKLIVDIKKIITKHKEPYVFSEANIYADTIRNGEKEVRRYVVAVDADAKCYATPEGDEANWQSYEPFPIEEFSDTEIMEIWYDVCVRPWEDK